jgi:hypothetical protein
MKIEQLTFEVNKKQLKKLEKWRKLLKTKHPSKFKDGLEPMFSYKFTPTGIGNGLEVSELHSKEKIDLTDIDSW